MWVESYNLMVEDQQTWMEITDQQRATYEYHQLKNHRPMLNMLKKLLWVDFAACLCPVHAEKSTFI